MAPVELKNRLVELLRMPIGDKLSLRVWYDEAQQVVRLARAHQVELPAGVVAWLSSAEARAKDPVLAATQSAAVAAFLNTLVVD